MISDLTYVRVGTHMCIFVDLFNREIIGYSAGEHKTATLVKEAFQSVKGNLQDIRLFHTDRGNEFKNQTIEELQNHKNGICMERKICRSKGIETEVMGLCKLV